MPDFNHFGDIAEQLTPVISQVVRKAAFDVEAAAASLAPVDTGFLKNSIYVRTSQDSDYGNAGSAPGDSYLLPEMEAPPDETTAYVAVGANYGIYQEMGTRFMPAHPYLAPAVEQVRPSFEAALSAIESKLGGS